MTAAFLAAGLTCTAGTGETALAEGWVSPGTDEQEGLGVPSESGEAEAGGVNEAVENIADAIAQDSGNGYDSIKEAPAAEGDEEGSTAADPNGEEDTEQGEEGKDSTAESGDEEQEEAEAHYDTEKLQEHYDLNRLGTLIRYRPEALVKTEYPEENLSTFLFLKSSPSADSAEEAPYSLSGFVFYDSEKNYLECDLEQNRFTGRRADGTYYCYLFSDEQVKEAFVQSIIGMYDTDLRNGGEVAAAPEEEAWKTQDRVEYTVCIKYSQEEANPGKPEGAAGDVFQADTFDLGYSLRLRQKCYCRDESNNENIFSETEFVIEPKPDEGEEFKGTAGDRNQAELEAIFAGDEELPSGQIEEAWSEDHKKRKITWHIGTETVEEHIPITYQAVLYDGTDDLVLYDENGNVYETSPDYDGDVEVWSGQSAQI